MKECLHCGKEVTARYNKFCNRSCAASYNNVRKPKKDKGNCLQCNKVLTSSVSKYCSSVCSGLYYSAQKKKAWYDGDIKSINRSTMRKYIAEDKGYKCVCCGISDYNGLPITLQVDHIDGNPGNHVHTNVRLICPNCHSQQDNWGARNKGSGRKSRGMSLS